MIRSTRAYDDASQNLIAKQYAELTHRYFRTSPEAVASSLLSTVDLLWNNTAPQRDE